MRNFKTALRSAKKAVSLQPILGLRIICWRSSICRWGKTAKPSRRAEKPLNINPKDQTAVYHLIQALRKTGDKTELPDLLKRLAELRQEATRQEEQHNRYKLVEGNAPQNQE